MALRDTCARDPRNCAGDTLDTELTGNDYVSIPLIRPDGAIDGLNVVHGTSAGLIEWAGSATEPLLRPRITLGGVPVDMAGARWRRLDRWIPTFSVDLPDGSTITGTVCAPGGYPPARGFFLRIEADNRARGSQELRVELEVTWIWSRLWISSARALAGDNAFHVPPSGHALILETDAGRGPALALGGSHVLGISVDDDGSSARNGTQLRARLSQSVAVKSNSRGAVTFHAGAGRERDGALAAAVTLRRHDADHWLRQARLELSHTLRSAEDHRWADLLNRNLLFNRWFAVGRGIDDDRLYLLRSRSTACPGPALFNEREALFWTLPALMIADPGIAREAMFRAFELTSERSGEFLRYIDGGAYDTAFSLDQFLMYAWCIDRYVKVTGDTMLLEDPLVRQILHETDNAAFMRLHPQHLLAATELLPSGDPVDFPFATLANVLLWSFSERLPSLVTVSNGDPPPRFQDAAPEVAAAVWQHCVSDVGGHPVLASSSDLDGHTAIYDDPSLSLALLPYFGFCSMDDPVWRATMDFLRSSQYPLWREGAVGGLAARSGGTNAHTAAVCADLLTHRSQDALDRLLRIRLTDGLAAAEYDPASGDVSIPQHAALAGFIAWSLVHAAESKEPAPSRKRRR